MPCVFHQWYSIHDLFVLVLCAVTAALSEERDGLDSVSTSGLNEGAVLLLLAGTLPGGPHKLGSRTHIEGKAWLSVLVCCCSTAKA